MYFIKILRYIAKCFIILATIFKKPLKADYDKARVSKNHLGGRK